MVKNDERKKISIKKAFCVKQWLITGKCVCRYVKYFSKNCYLLLIKQICENYSFFCQIYKDIEYR